ncbi:MAG: hypothetical protein ACRDSH_07405, partial [Pseudonocardiaceae bacterium]
MVDVNPEQTSLRSANFSFYVAADAASTLGTGIAVVAVPFAILAQRGTATQVGSVLAAALVALLGALVIAGVVADRLVRARIMVLANGVQAAAQLTSAAVIALGLFSTPVLAAVQALRG